MPSLEQLRRAVSWAAREVGIRQSCCAKVRVLPWSATANLSIGQRRYWVKVSPPRNSTIESKILTLARERRLSSVPTLVSSSDDLNTILMEHVPSHPGTLRAADIVASKNRVCDALTNQAEQLDLTALTASGCADIILSNCRNRSPWIDIATMYALAKMVEACDVELADLDRSLPRVTGVVHGDFHPGNVLTSLGGPVFIDWADAAYGAQIWDQATFEISSGQLTNIGNSSDAHFSVIAGLKEIADFLLTPHPIPGGMYSVSIPHLRTHISRRAATLIYSLGILRHSE